MKINGPHSMRHVPIGWRSHPNLRLRPHAPNAGRGRIQTAVRRAFLGHTFRTTSEVFDFALVRVRHDEWRQRNRWSIIRVLRELADPVGRDRAHGAIIWRLKNGIDYGHKPQKPE
jgi:hypothetical protein